jgi:hypothetical protein
LIRPWPRDPHDLAPPASTPPPSARARTSTRRSRRSWLEQRRAELALAAEVRARLQAEVEHLEHRLHDAEVERSDLTDKLTHRDRLLGQIFGSRSWRWTQALRRMLRRP